VITISEYSARAIRRYLRFPADRIDVIPLAGRTTLSVANVTRAPDLFLAMGQRSPYKDFPTVVRAWAAIAPELRPRLVITGSHGDDPLRPLVDSLGLGPWIDLREWVSTEELAELFGTATAIIDSTLASGFSLPTLEAMALGVPVLLADTEVFREVGGSAAAYFRAGDPGDLARAVVAMAADPNRRATLSAAGRAHAAGYSWDKVARQTLASFEKALAQPR
jgi:glycosyltransferase involved in cell wall biosynthesis